MTQDKLESRIESEAMARVRVKFGFLQHLATYFVVIGGLACINLLSDARYLWFLWPALGWGIGLLAHAVNVFVMPALFQRMTDRELRRRHP